MQMYTGVGSSASRLLPVCQAALCAIQIDHSLSEVIWKESCALLHDS